MAATPPPYTPRDARWESRQARRAARAQWKAQARAQRDYYRQYWHGFRRPSFVGPLLLLTIGVLALLMETGRLDAVVFWAWYAHWWPVILIALGGLLLGEYFLDSSRPWAGHRSMGGLFWLVVLLIGLGLMARHGHFIRPFASQFSEGDEFLRWMGPEHDNDVQIDQALTMAKPSVTINNAHGDVTIAPSTDGQMHLRAHEIVHRSSDAEAQKVFGELKPDVKVTSSGAVISIPEREGARVDLTAELPAATFAILTISHGDLTTDGLTGGLQVTSSHGDVKLEDIGANIECHIDQGDLAAHNIQGRVILDGRGDDVTLSEIQGSATINGDYFGDIHLEQIGSAVHYHSSMTTLDIPRLVGSLTLDKDTLSISKAAGPVRIVARSKDIDLTQIAGDIHIEDTNGDINLVSAAPLGNIQIADHTGNVIVTIPQDASFTVNGSTSGDEAIRTDFPLRISTEGDRQTLRGSVGHSPIQLQLDTEHGSLELRKGENATLAVTPPEAPAAPNPPGSGKHFRAAPGSKPVEQEE
jgi:DUF4097 and DUF4098 domain-containing protein YvlB